VAPAHGAVHPAHRARGIHDIGVEVGLIDDGRELLALAVEHAHLLVELPEPALLLLRGGAQRRFAALAHDRLGDELLQLLELRQLRRRDARARRPQRHRTQAPALRAQQHHADAARPGFAGCPAFARRQRQRLAALRRLQRERPELAADRLAREVGARVPGLSSTCSASIVNAAAAGASTIDAINATASSSTRWTESAPSNWSRCEVRRSGSPPGRDAGIATFP
jgi:hypothetical protein